MIDTATPVRDSLPALDSADARRAVVDAARYDGMTCCRGAFEARRTNIEPEPNARPGVIEQVVTLSTRDPPTDTLAWFRVTDFRTLRDDWGHPTPCDPGEAALPADEYDVADLFPDVEVLPGSAEEVDDA